jgi:hypothetical protein
LKHVLSKARIHFAEHDDCGIDYLPRSIRWKNMKRGSPKLPDGKADSTEYKRLLRLSSSKKKTVVPKKNDKKAAARRKS